MTYVSKSYSVVVPYRGHLTIQCLVAAGDYDWVDRHVTDEHFPPCGGMPAEFAIELVEFDGFLSKGDVHRQLIQRTLRPANTAELLALCAMRPELPTDSLTIVGLGQSWRDASRRLHVVSVTRLGRRRAAGLAWADREWNSKIQFAAINAKP